MNRQLISIPEDFVQSLYELEKSFLTEKDPIRQSGFGGGETRWKNERRLILEAIDSDGDFLDIGCANGYLLQCLAEWANAKSVILTPFGVDQGVGLIELAGRRFPQYASHFWVANAWNWKPPRKFCYVYTLYDCVPEDFFEEYIRRLLTGYVESGGTLIIGAYGSTSKNEPARDIGKDLRSIGFSVAGTAYCGELPVSRVAWVRVG
ncbi:MAG: class I SAM-dependent methyltransferase [Candidatus Hatepunaea meridiana]|nr:class I SAM-dependent methyltransferase [Candidatus Hatepunaea meridiana]